MARSKAEPITFFEGRSIQHSEEVYLGLELSKGIFG